MRRAPVARSTHRSPARALIGPPLITHCLVTSIIAAAITLMVTVGAVGASSVSVPSPVVDVAEITLVVGTSPPDPADPPPVTVNPFFPEDRSLSECLSVVPRPGCGSEARGGPYQAAVFGVILLGLGVIGTRIVIGVRRNRASTPESTG